MYADVPRRRVTAVPQSDARQIPYPMNHWPQLTGKKKKEQDKENLLKPSNRPELSTRRTIDDLYSGINGFVQLIDLVLLPFFRWLLECQIKLHVISRSRQPTKRWSEQRVFQKYAPSSVLFTLIEETKGLQVKFVSRTRKHIIMNLLPIFKGLITIIHAIYHEGREEKKPCHWLIINHFKFNIKHLNTIRRK